MRKPLLIPLIVTGLLFVAAVAFAAWAFMGRQDYKDNSDQKVTAAVQVAQQQTSDQKDKQFAAAEKLPLRTYTGPAPYGSLKIQYPKTWSVYVSELTDSSKPIDAYFNPGFVPATGQDGVVYALRAQISSQLYSDVVSSFQSFIKAGKLTATPYIPVNETSVTGLRLDGQLTSKVTGSMVVLPIRDKTLEIWTESPQFVNDFNTNILPNFTFSK
ncbi:MAG: hypothetical protein ABI221_01600 [Candidatus Saccharimonadales bacterium]